MVPGASKNLRLGTKEARLPGAGRFVKVLMLLVALVCIIGLCAFISKYRGEELTWFTLLSIFVVGVLPVLAAIRALFFGVWIDDSGIRYRCWFKQGKVLWADLYEIGSVEYRGVFTKGGPGLFLYRLELRARPFKEIELSSTMTLKRASARQAERLRSAALARGWQPLSSSGRHHDG